jgi:hypothetical protein
MANPKPSTAPTPPSLALVILLQGFQTDGSYKYLRNDFESGRVSGQSGPERSHYVSSTVTTLISAISSRFAWCPRVAVAISRFVYAGTVGKPFELSPRRRTASVLYGPTFTQTFFTSNQVGGGPKYLFVSALPCRGSGDADSEIPTPLRRRLDPAEYRHPDGLDSSPAVGSPVAPAALGCGGIALSDCSQTVSSETW